MSDKRHSTGPSWVAVILLMIFFLPVGLILLYFKLTADKTDLPKIIKVQKTFGWIIFLSSIAYIVIFASDKDTFSTGANFTARAIFVVVLFVLGMVLIGKGQINKKRLTEIEENEIDRGDVAYEVEEPLEESPEENEVSEAPQIKVVVCRSCGASVTIKTGEVSKCKYCSSLSTYPE